MANFIYASLIVPLIVGTFCACGDDPHLVLVSAVPRSPTKLLVTFDRGIDSASIVDAKSQFTLDNGLTASAARVNERTVTLTTSSQVDGTVYTLMVASSVLGSTGLAVAAPDNSVQFTGPGRLEIGERTMEGGFEPWTDSQAVAVSLGANGLNMIVPSLRAYDIEPKGPIPLVEVEIGGILMAADIKVAGSAADDMTDLGVDGFAMWQLSVAFQTNLCCYNCAMGNVSASIIDATGRQFAGEIALQLARDQCPAPSVCCGDADECPLPELAQLCQ